MADFDLTETNYEDFYLSNFLGKKKTKKSVEVEVIAIEENSISADYSDTEIEESNHIVIDERNNKRIESDYSI